MASNSFSPQANQWLNNSSGATPSASTKIVSPGSSGAQWLSAAPAPKPLSKPTAPVKTKLSEYQQASPLRRTISDLAHGVANTIHNLPEAHFADKMNFFTPVGFAANLAQGLINTPAEAFKGSLSLGEHGKAGTSTPQQVIGDVAAAVQLPLMLLTGGESSIVKEGLEQTAKNTFTQGVKGVVKAGAKGMITGGGFGLLGGLQSGKDITNASDYVKNLLENVGIGAGTGGIISQLDHVVLPLAKGFASKAGAIFVKNVDKTPVIQHVQMDPKVAQSSVLGNEELAKSPVGKEILKQSVIATKTDRHVTITPSENGAFSLPDGTKVDIGTAHIYDPEQKVADQAVKDKNGLSVEDYVNAKENKFRLSDPRTTESPLEQAEKLFVENFKGSNELWNDITKDPSKETIDKAIDWLSTRDSSISKNYYTQKAIKLAHYIDAAKTGAVVNAPSGIGLEIPAQPKFRIKEDFAKKGINITDKQESDIVELNKKIFGDTDVKVTGQILADGKALGAYKDGIIKILDGQGDAKDTYLHEVVHKYLDLFTNKQEHMDILTEGEKQYKLNDYAQVEEKLAEDFIKYAKDREGVTGTLRLHFDNILLRIKKYLGNSSKIEELYNEILNANKDKVPEDIRPEEKPSFEQLQNNGEKLQGKDRPLESSNQTTTEGQQPVGTGKPRESEAFSKFVDNLKEADPKRYEELKDGKITYNRLNLEQDAKNAMKLVEKDPQQAYRIAKGIEQAPAGQTETAISIALADRAGREGDFAKQAELESSRSLRQTRRGQEIVSERGRFNDNSPYRYIQDVLDKRLKDLGSSIMSKVKYELPDKKTSRKKAAVERLDNETKKVKTMLTKEQRKVKLAQSILDQLTCK